MQKKSKRESLLTAPLSCRELFYYHSFPVMRAFDDNFVGAAFGDVKTVNYKSVKTTTSEQKKSGWKKFAAPSYQQKTERNCMSFKCLHLIFIS